MVGKMIKRTCLGAAAATLLAVPLSLASFAADPKTVGLRGDRAYPESISATADGTLYVSSLASGGVWRIKPGASTAEQWIEPGAFDSRSTFGVMAEEKTGTLWVCSNDVSAGGVPGPSDVKGSYLKGFDLASGEGKVSVPLPGGAAVCNDIAIAQDGSLFVTNSLAPQILRLKPGAESFEIWLESPSFEQPANGGAGLDGIAFGGDGNIYVNNFSTGSFFRIEMKNGVAGTITKLKTPRALRNPDGLRSLGHLTFLMAEGGGPIERVTVKGDAVALEPLQQSLAGPTGVALVGHTLWGAEGQLTHLFDPKTGPPKLPFRIVGIEMRKQ